MGKGKNAKALAALTRKNAKALAALTRPLHIGSVAWDGSEDELAAAIDQGISELQQLLKDLTSGAASTAKSARGSALTAGSAETVVTVKTMSGDTTEIGLC